MTCSKGKIFSFASEEENENTVIPLFYLPTLNFSYYLLIFIIHRIMIKVPGYLTEKGFTMTIKNNTANQVDAHVTPNVHRERKILINFPKVL